MKIGSVVAMAAVVLSGSMLAVSRGRGAPDFSALPAVAQSTPAAVAFTNVNVVPMDSERILRDQTVLVEQGRIRRLGSADEVRVPADVTTVDGSGKYLMPGLAEMHGHMPGGEVEEMVMFYHNRANTTLCGLAYGKPLFPLSPLNPPFDVLNGGPIGVRYEVGVGLLDDLGRVT